VSVTVPPARVSRPGTPKEKHAQRSKIEDSRCSQRLEYQGQKRCISLIHAVRRSGNAGGGGAAATQTWDRAWNARAPGSVWRLHGAPRRGSGSAGSHTGAKGEEVVLGQPIALGGMESTGGDARNSGAWKTGGHHWRRRRYYSRREKDKGRSRGGGIGGGAGASAIRP